MAAKGAPGTVDFMFSNPGSSDLCSSTAASSNADAVLKKLRSAINENLLILGLISGLVGITLMLVGYVASMMLELLQQWRAGVAAARISGPDPIEPPPLTYGDDVVYRRRAPPAAVLALREGVPEATLVKARMAALAKRYKAYNEAIGRHADNSKDAGAADDLVDARVLSRGNDDYTYDTARGRSGVVRKGEGAERGDAGSDAAKVAASSRDAADAGAR
jgi:hypothetical protein